MVNEFIAELWDRRSQIILFALNDVRLRYKNSVLGFIWTFLEPLLMLTVLYLVFTNIFKGEILHYPLYILLSLIIWYMFTRATTLGISSLVDKSGIITKIYFRREIVVISSNLTAFIMMTVEFAVLPIFLIVFQFLPPLTGLLLPLLLVDLFFLTLGISFLLSILNARFRDVQLIWQVVVTAGFFLSPIIYSLDMFPENVRRILELNPMAVILTVAQDLVLYDTLPTVNSIIYIVSVTFTIFIIGLFVFRKKVDKVVEEL